MTTANDEVSAMRTCDVPGCGGAHCAKGLCRPHYMAEWQANNREKTRAHAAKWRQANPEKVRENWRAWSARRKAQRAQ